MDFYGTLYLITVVASAKGLCLTAFTVHSIKLVYGFLAQLFPSSFSFGGALSENGSSATGNCNDLETNASLELSRCNSPRTSVLFDGNTPTLTGLDGDMWASQLLVLQVLDNEESLTFDFSENPNYTRLDAIELVMFNCPDRGTGIQDVLVESSRSTSSGTKQPVVNIRTSSLTSCDSLVTICTTMVGTFHPVVFLRFNTASASDRVYLAEARFHTSAPLNPIACPLCLSCFIPNAAASAITAVVTALLATLIFVLVLVVIFKCDLHQKFTAGSSRERAGGEGRALVAVGHTPTDEGAREAALSDPAYDSVDTRQVGEGEIVLQDNRAYASFH